MMPSDNDCALLPCRQHVRVQTPESQVTDPVPKPETSEPMLEMLDFPMVLHFSKIPIWHEGGVRRSLSCFLPGGTKNRGVSIVCVWRARLGDISPATFVPG